jgi:hypothetical protein
MVGLDEGALICDFAETYHVYNWRALPVSTAATLAMGLRPESRMMQKLSGAPAPADTLLRAMIADCLRILVWRQTKDGQRGKKPPASILEQMLGGKRSEIGPGFENPDDFQAWRSSMMEG